ATSITGAITGSGSLVEIGTSSLTLNPATPSNFSGGTVLANGSESLILGSNNSPLGTGPVTLVGNPATVRSLQTTVSGGFNFTNSLILNNPQALFNQNATLGGSNPFRFSGPVILNGLNTVSFGVATTISGPISGSGALTKIGNGSLILAGVDSHAGV